jgi:hypothetical protein
MISEYSIIGTAVVIIIIAAALFFAVRYMIKERKAGGCASCPYRGQNTDYRIQNCPGCEKKDK